MSLPASSKGGGVRPTTQTSPPTDATGTVTSEASPASSAKLTFPDGGRTPNSNWRETLEAAELPNAGPDLLIALDIDGTTLRHDTTLSPRVRDAVHAHIDAGTTIMVATGRGVAGTQVALEQIGWDTGYAVSSNGSIILTLGNDPDERAEDISELVRLDTVPVRLLKSHTFDPSREIEIIAEGLPGTVLALESLTHRTRITSAFPPGELSGHTEIVDIADLAIPNATRLTVRAPHMDARELLAAVNEIGLHGVEYAVGWSAWLDIAPEGISKAVGISDVCDMAGIERRNTVCIGDSGNDCEMLEWAGVGVAMGNAPEYVRSFADTVTEDVNDDGCALVLEALLN